MPPTQAIDIRTLFLTLVVMTALLGTLSILFARQEPRTRALSSWGWGMLAIGAGLLIAALPATPPRSLVTAAGNTLVVAGVVLLGRGVARIAVGAMGALITLVFGVLALGVKETLRYTPVVDRYEPLVESLGLYRRVR